MYLIIWLYWVGYIQKLYCMFKIWCYSVSLFSELSWISDAFTTHFNKKNIKDWMTYNQLYWMTSSVLKSRLNTNTTEPLTKFLSLSIYLSISLYIYLSLYLFLFLSLSLSLWGNSIQSWYLLFSFKLCHSCIWVVYYLLLFE